MRYKKLFTSALLITTSLFLFTGCGEKAEPVSAEPTETINEVDTEESLENTEPSPSPIVEPTEESIDDTVSSESGENIESEEDIINEEEIQSEETEPDIGYTIIAIDEVTMYATTNANLRSGPDTTYDIVGSLTYGESAVFNGYVEEGGSVWYIIKTDNEEIKMVSKSLVSSEKPQPQQPSSSGNSGGSSSGGSSGSQTSGGGSLDDILGPGDGITGGFFIPGAGENAGAGNDSAIGDGSGAGGLDINWQ